jgi:hypothetical protein
VDRLEVDQWMPPIPEAKGALAVDRPELALERPTSAFQITIAAVAANKMCLRQVHRTLVDKSRQQEIQAKSRTEYKVRHSHIIINTISSSISNNSKGPQ